MKSVPSMVSPQMKSASDILVNVGKSFITLASVTVLVITFASYVLTFMEESGFAGSEHLSVGSGGAVGHRTASRSNVNLGESGGFRGTASCMFAQ